MSEKFKKFNNPEPGKETKQNAEIQAEFLKFDKEANEIGQELENTDFTKIEPTEALKLRAKMDMMFGALMIATGATTLGYSVDSAITLGYSIDTMLDPSYETEWRAIVTALGVLGSCVGTAIAASGLQTMVEGYRKFIGYVKKYQAEFYKDFYKDLE